MTGWTPQLTRMHSHTLKDHKPNFANKPTCRLINLTKSEIGKISKTILDRINRKIMRASKFNQLKNTASVIEWFKVIKNKHQFYLLRHRIILPLHQPRPPQQSTRLRLSLRQHHRRRKKHYNTCKTFDPYAQTTTLAKEG